MKIAIVGLGYVGLSNAVLLSQYHDVVALEISQAKVDLVNSGISPIVDADISEYLATKRLALTATTSKAEAIDNADYVIICAPTDYDEVLNFFNTSIVDEIIKDVSERNPNATIVIKSTIPVGYTNNISARFNNTILFSPEFLREGKALYDNLYPSRVIVGVPDIRNAQEMAKATTFADLLIEVSLNPNTPVLLMGAAEAEAVKLFSNTYLAMRVAYFNELDTYADMFNLDAKDIINGVGLDPRIGMHYNNPSFGYGGYCLPKDSKQLLSNYKNVPNNLMKAIVEANTTRKKYLARKIIETLKTIKSPNKTVGIHRLSMKKESDNFRQSSILEIIDILNREGLEVIIYEPSIIEPVFRGNRIENDLEEFKKQSVLIICNRISKELEDVRQKIFTRDIFGYN